MATIDHTWQFFAPGVGDNAKVVVVCSACGLTRTGRVPTAVRQDHYVDLRGDCEGEPQEATVSAIEREAGG